jgi:hypothetical protein
MSGARSCKFCIHYYGTVVQGRQHWCKVVCRFMPSSGLCASFRLDRSLIARANWEAAYRLARIIHREQLDGLLTSAHPVITAASRALEAREGMHDGYYAEDDYDEEDDGQ